MPVLFDSPHSGTVYPADFDAKVPRLVLRRAEDTHVEALYAAAPDHGATLIAANFPRSYIDANRSLLDIDAALLDSA
jgi:N-formylglutamate deformylase